MFQTLYKLWAKVRLEERIMEDKMTVKQFLDEMEIYYEAYYEDKEGFDNKDDVAAVIDLAFKFYEQHRGKKYGK